MARLSITLISGRELLADAHPELNIRLVIDGITHDPAGDEPPRSLEVRMSPSALHDLTGQIRTLRLARFADARADAERELAEEQDRIRASEVAVNDTRVDTGVIQRVASALRDHNDEHVS